MKITFLIFNKQKNSHQDFNLTTKKQHFQTKISQNSELFMKILK